jgi:streptogramin lyase
VAAVATVLLAVACSSSPGGPTPPTGTSTTAPTTVPSTTAPTTTPEPEGTPTNEPEAVLDVGGYPNGLAFAAGGMWYADPAASEVFRIDPASGEVLQRVHAGRSSFLLVFAFGSLWVTNHLVGEVARIDPATGEVTAKIKVGSTSASLVPTADGMWASAGDGDAVRIDPRTNEVVQTIHFGGDLQGMAVAFGSLWLTIFEDSHVLRFDLRTGKALRPLGLGDGAGGLAVADDRLWGVASTDTTLHALWPPGKRTTIDLGIGAAPFLLTAIGDRLYAGDRFASRVQEIDPAAGTVVAVHEVPSPVIAMARGAGGVWATSGDAGAIAKIGGAC